MAVYGLFIIVIATLILIDLFVKDFSSALNRTLRLLIAWIGSTVVMALFLSTVHSLFVYTMGTLILVLTYKLLKGNSFSNFQRRLISIIKGSN